VRWRRLRNTAGDLPNESGQSQGYIFDEDYQFWRSQFGRTAFGSAGIGTSEAIPEPATWVLLIVAEMFTFGYVRNRRSNRQ
jgi:hypothetical protein